MDQKYIYIYIYIYVYVKKFTDLEIYLGIDKIKKNV